MSDRRPHGIPEPLHSDLLAAIQSRTDTTTDEGTDWATDLHAEVVALVARAMAERTTADDGPATDGGMPDPLWRAGWEADRQRMLDALTDRSEALRACERERDALADEIERLRQRDTETVECTGVSARWCPLHGDCTCPSIGSPNDPGDRATESEGCPLHDMSSPHAEAPRRDTETVLRGLAETFDGLAAGWRDAPFSGTNAHERRASGRSFSEAAQVVRAALRTLGEATDE